MDDSSGDIIKLSHINKDDYPELNSYYNEILLMSNNRMTDNNLEEDNEESGKIVDERQLHSQDDQSHIEENDNIICKNDVHTLSFADSILNDSRLTPTGNGNISCRPYCTQPTSGQKWWTAVLLGFIFALISSRAFYSITTSVTSNFGIYTNDVIDNRIVGHTPIGLIIHTIIFILIIRILLW